MIVLSGPTITVVLYVTVVTSFIMILARMTLSYKLNRRWTAEDAWMTVALCFLVGLLFSGSGIKYDTNNVKHPELLTPEQITRRVMGSKTVLVGRFSYASSIWAMKFCILAVYSRIVNKLPKYQKYVWAIWALLFLTWMAVAVVTLFECRPFKHYWQVYPSPAAGCKTARGQIYVVGICNMITDLILIIFPMPIVIRTRLPLRRKLELCSLFSLGFIIITISSLRLWVVMQNGALQRWRTLFGSLELFSACCVTNGPIFYRAIMDRRHTPIVGKNLSTSTANSSSFGRSVGRTRMAGDEDLELAEVREGSVEVQDMGHTSAKGSSTNIGMWEVGEHGSQEFLEVR